MAKFSKKELEYFSQGDPLYPDGKGIVASLYAKKEKYLRSIGATDEDIEEGDDLCPEEFWWHACNIVAALAQNLLDERERKYDHWMEFVKSIESEVKTLKKELKN